MPLVPDDVDEIFDAIIGDKKASATEAICVSAPNVIAGTVTMAESELTFGSGGTAHGIALGRFTDGDRITAFSVMLLGTGATFSPALALMLNKGDGSPVLLATLTIVNPPASWAMYTVALGTPHVMLPGESLYFNQPTATPPLAAGTSIATAFVTRDRL